MDKTKNIFLFFVLLSANLFSQSVGINSTGATPNASAILDLNTGNNGTQGFLPEEVNLTATNVAAPITTPSTGLMVYNKNTAGASPTNVVPGYYYWDGAKWVYLITNPKVSIPVPWLNVSSAFGFTYYNPGYNSTNSTASAPTSVAYNYAYQNDNCFIVTSNGNFSKLYGWLNSNTANVTVTVSAYLYTPVNNSSANVAGVLIANQNVTLTTANANYAFEVDGNTALTKGQFIMVWYMPQNAISGGNGFNAAGTLEVTYIPQ